MIIAAISDTSGTHADAVIAVGGSAGTMSEICFAWIYKRLIIGMRVEGWSGRMADERVDERTRYPNEADDRIFGADSADDVARILADRLARFADHHRGVRRRD
jgi:predicted Rossmann-fold nucleotide-binding protein